jgi:hypothetical protein
MLNEPPQGNENGQTMFLAGNVTEGFRAFGPYSSFDEAAEIHDFEEGWIMELNTKTSEAKNDRG